MGLLHVPQQQLYLAQNQLTSLPDSIGDLEALEELWAYTNALESLPASIGRLRKLKKLIVFNNQITALTDSFDNLTALVHAEVEEDKMTTRRTTKMRTMISTQ